MLSLLQVIPLWRYRDTFGNLTFPAVVIEQRGLRGHLASFSGCLRDFSSSSSLSTSHVGVFEAEAVGWFTARGSEEGRVGIPDFDVAQDAFY